MHERRLMRIKVRRQEIALGRDQIRFAEESAKALSRLMDFEHLEQLSKLTNNPLGTLKILLSIYRRVRELAKYQRKRKARF
jgi:hypothetical protein